MCKWYDVLCLIYTIYYCSLFSSLICENTCLRETFVTHIMEIQVWFQHFITQIQTNSFTNSYDYSYVKSSVQKSSTKYSREIHIQ